jgi:hypothetical protein
MPLHEIGAWFAHNADLGEILDQQGERPRNVLLISEHADQLYSVEHGYGAACAPRIT